MVCEYKNSAQDIGIINRFYIDSGIKMGVCALFEHFGKGPMMQWSNP